MSTEFAQKYAQIYLDAKRAIATGKFDQDNLQSLMEGFSPKHANFVLKETFVNAEGADLPVKGFEATFSFPKDTPLEAIKALTLLSPDNLRQYPTKTSLSKDEEGYNVTFTSKTELPENANGDALAQFVLYDSFRAISLNAARLGIYQSVPSNSQEVPHVPDSLFDRMPQPSLLVATERMKVPFSEDIDGLMKESLTQSVLDRIERFDHAAPMIARNLSEKLSAKPESEPQVTADPKEPEQKLSYSR